MSPFLSVCSTLPVAAWSPAKPSPAAFCHPAESTTPKAPSRPWYVRWSGIALLHCRFPHRRMRASSPVPAQLHPDELSASRCARRYSCPNRNRLKRQAPSRSRVRTTCVHVNKKDGTPWPRVSTGQQEVDGNHATCNASSRLEATIPIADHPGRANAVRHVHAATNIRRTARIA